MALGVAHVLKVHVPSHRGPMLAAVAAVDPRLVVAAAAQEHRGVLVWRE